MELRQFDFNFTRYTYILEETGLRLIKRGISSSTETFIEFEDIGSKTISEGKRKIVWVIISIVFLLIAISVFYKRIKGGKVGEGAEVFHATASMVFCLIYFLTKRNTLYVVQPDNSNAIEFIAIKRYKRKVDEFIKALFVQRDAYLLDKYSTLDEFLPYNQQYNNLVWLYNLKLLTKEQLQRKIRELDAIDFDNPILNKSSHLKIVGFSKKDDGGEGQEDE